MGRDESGFLGRIGRAGWDESAARGAATPRPRRLRFHLREARPPTGANSCRLTTIATSLNPRPPPPVLLRTGWRARCRAVAPWFCSRRNPPPEYHVHRADELKSARGRKADFNRNAVVPSNQAQNGTPERGEATAPSNGNA
jgi:hypothetical protein